MISTDDNAKVVQILDSTPGLVKKKYSNEDEQALLAVVRYNKLLDVFLSISCHSLQNHLRTSMDIGQIEIDA